MQIPQAGRRMPLHTWGSWLLALTRRTRASQRGSLLAEAVVAVFIFTLVGTAALTGLSTMLNVGSKADSQAAAESLGRNQMEYLFSLVYREPPATYPAVPAPPGYTVSAVAESLDLNDPNIEKVVVTVSRDGQAVLVLETFRLME